MKLPQRVRGDLKKSQTEPLHLRKTGLILLVWDPILSRLEWILNDEIGV